MIVFNPSMQHRYTQDVRRIFCGQAPTLRNVARAYGYNVAISWLMCQLSDLSEFCGCKDKLSIKQIEDISIVILSQFDFINVVEFMYFFLLFKAGQFGRFYGAVDGIVITEAIQKFRELRMEKRNEYEEQERKQQAILKDLENALHDAEVRNFWKALAKYNIKLKEWAEISRLYAGCNLTTEDIEDIGWLLRI